MVGRGQVVLGEVSGVGVTKYHIWIIPLAAIMTTQWPMTHKWATQSLEVNPSPQLMPFINISAIVQVITLEGWQNALRKADQ